MEANKHLDSAGNYVRVSDTVTFAGSTWTVVSLEANGVLKLTTPALKREHYVESKIVTRVG